MQMIVLFQLMNKDALHVDDTFYYNLANNDSLVLKEITANEHASIYAISLPINHMMR